MNGARLSVCAQGVGKLTCKNFLAHGSELTKIKQMNDGACKFFLIAIFVFGLAPALFAQQQPILTKLEFRGNDKISSRALRGAIKTKATPRLNSIFFWREDRYFDEQVFLTDLLRLEKFYHQEGFLEAIVADYRLKQNEEENEVEATVYIKEGRPMIVNRIEFEPANGIAIPLPRSSLLRMVNLKEGERYREAVLRRDYENLVVKFSDRGYPYVEPRVKPVWDRANYTAALEWHIDPGPLCYFGEITILGNREVSAEPFVVTPLGVTLFNEPFVVTPLGVTLFNEHPCLKASLQTYLIQ
jgi:outer membrane protein insertion porin family